MAHRSATSIPGITTRGIVGVQSDEGGGKCSSHTLPILMVSTAISYATKPEACWWETSGAEA